jgi:hypothetical protein
MGDLLLISIFSLTFTTDYQLVFDNKYVLPQRGPNPAKEMVGPGRWKILDAPADQWITVPAAIRYVTQMHDSTTDPVLRRNADATLRTLRLYH